MKLLIAFVHADDRGSVSEELRSSGLRFTRLPSIGGFLEEDSSTFILAVEDADLDGALGAFERSSKARDVEVPLVLRERLADWRARTVRQRGATILVGELERVVQT